MPTMVTPRLLVLILVILWGSFVEDTAGGEERGVPTPNRLVIHLSAEPATLNPITATDAYAAQIDDYLYESLLKRDERTLELVPLLASSWEIADNHLSFTFHLRRDVSWHDGHPFTAKDVVFSYERIMDPSVDALHLRNYYQDIAKVEAMDDFTVVFTYTRPYFKALEVCGTMPIVPAHLFTDTSDFNRHPLGRSPVGTGPYVFERWETGKEIVLRRHEGYWGEQPPIEQVVFKIITDSTVALQVLKQEGLDFMGLRPLQWVYQTRGKRFQKHFQKLSYYTPH